LAVACLACIAYGVALFSTAIGGFWTGPDFDHAPMSGWDCLLSGWFHFPIGWLANPVLFAAIFLLLSGFRIAAFLLGILAIGLVRYWTYEFCQQFPAKLLMAGCDWWLFSIEALVAGSFCSMVLHCLETWQSLTSLGRTCRKPLTNVQESG
jgi:hypothetical protein